MFQLTTRSWPPAAPGNTTTAQAITKSARRGRAPTGRSIILSRPRTRPAVKEGSAAEGHRSAGSLSHLRSRRFAPVRWALRDHPPLARRAREDLPARQGELFDRAVARGAGRFLENAEQFPAGDLAYV